MTVFPYTLAFVLCLTATVARQAPAQRSGSGVIRITLNDTGPNRPAKPFEIYVMVPATSGSRSMFASYQVHGGPDHYVIDGLPDDRVIVRIYCSREGPVGYDREFPFVVRATTPIDTTITVDHVGCDQRAIRTETRVFTGFYTPGFESSRFDPCPNDSWIILSDTAGVPRYSLKDIPKEFESKMAPHAWVTWAVPKGAKSFSWPKIEKRDAWGNATYFVRWHGTMTGPGNYGHMGVSEFELKVDRLIAIEEPNARSCAR